MNSRILFEDLSQQYLVEILFIILGAFMLGYLFRYFLNDRLNRRLRQLAEERDEALSFKDIQVLKTKYEGIIEEKDERILKLNKELSNLRVEEVEKTRPKSKLKNRTDKLSVIEGIGPKIALILNESGIRTYAQLSTYEPKKIRKILMKASPAYAVHDPQTWPEQAKMASEEKWEELKAFQKHLKAGKRIN